MNKIIEIDYNIGDYVKIIPIELNGIVISIHIAQRGIRYEIRYFDDKTAKTEFFFSSELNSNKMF